MDLKSGYPFWPIHNGLVATFPPHDRNSTCDVLVAGAGITGALVAHSLSDAGLDVIVLDRRDAGWGSSSASTAMLQYEIDTELRHLVQQYGEDRAVAIYKACEAAIPALENIVRGIKPAGFQRMQSLYAASRPWHGSGVREEGALRQKHGFALEILDRDATRERFGIAASASLVTKVAAQLDPYRTALEILDRLRRRGVSVHDRTGLVDWRSHGRNLEVRTERATSIRCRHLVLAMGYEAQRYLRPRVARNRSSYALVSEPLVAPPSWVRKTIFWESARPYLYSRTTADERLLVGGEDDKWDIPARRDIQVSGKAAKLVKKMGVLMPALSFETAFAWAGTFAETADGLPFFGPHPQHGPRVHFAMAYGGNGIVYSVLGAELLRDRILRKRHPLAEFLSFSRLG